MKAGWYHFEGDPHDTVRRWNGNEWIGFSVPNPEMTTVSMHGSATRRRLERLDAAGVRMGYLTVVTMVVLTVLFATLSLLLFRAARAIVDQPLLQPANEIESQLRELFSFGDGIAALIGLIVVGSIVCVIQFVSWMRRAAAGAGISHRTRRRKRNGKKKLTLGWLVLALYFNPITAAESFGPRPIVRVKTRARARGFHAVVSDIAGVAGANPRDPNATSSISPLPIMAWWMLWWVPVFALGISFIWNFIAGPPSLAGLRDLAVFYGALAACEVGALVCIIFTILQINPKLARRSPVPT